LQEALEKARADHIHIHEVPLSETLDDIPLARINPDPWLGDERFGKVC